MGAIRLADFIRISPLKRIPVQGGDVLHVLKNTDEGYNNFGEAYFSAINKGTIKAWKRHREMTLNLVVPVGLVRFVFCTPDMKEFREEIIGESNYVRITVQPGVWFGFQGLHSSESLILNIGNIKHDPNEVDRKEITDINFKWN